MSLRAASGIDVLIASTHNRSSLRGNVAGKLRIVAFGVFSIPVIGLGAASLWVMALLALEPARIWLTSYCSRKGDDVRGVILFAVFQPLHALVFASLALLLWCSESRFGAALACMVLIWAFVRSTLACRGEPCGLLHSAPLALVFFASPFVAHSWRGQPLPSLAFWLGSALLFGGAVSWTREIAILNRTATASLKLAEQRRCEAESATAAKSAFVAMVSHELRTPINGVLATAQDLLSAVEDQAVKERAAIISDAGYMMRTLLNDLLDLSKLDAGKMTIEATAFDLAALVDQTRAFFAPQAASKGVQFVVRLANPLPNGVVGDPTRLRQILNNLLSNALKFTECGQVALTAEILPMHDGRLKGRFSVEDTGPGMNEERLARLFRPFDQTDSSVARTHGGTGLGLAISRDLARLMGGDINVSSRVGVGTVFTVDIILEVAEAAPIQVATPLEPPPPAFDALQVLIAEDHEINRRVFKLLLEPLGAEITFALDGEVALSDLMARPYDIVLTDLHMPRVSGLELAQRVRAAPGPNRTTPILAVSGSSTAADVQAMRAVGINGHVPKPIEAELLFAAITSALAPSNDPQIQRSA